MIRAMRRWTRKALGVVGLAWLSANSLIAQENEGKPAELRFAAQTAPRDLGELVMVTEETRSEPFELPLNHLSDPQTAPARRVTLVRRDQPGTLATIRLPEAGDEFIILLVPGEETPFHAVVLPGANDSFRPGDYYVHNVSGRRVIGRVGETSFSVSSRDGRIVRPEGARDNRYYDVVLGIVDGKEKKVISTSRWPLSPRMRTYVFFFDNPARGGVDFRAIDEFVPQAE